MRQANLITLFLFVTVISSVGAISLDYNGATYSKGAKMVITGFSHDETVLMDAKHDGRQVFLETVDVALDGSFKFERQVSFLDPSGFWKVVVSDTRGSEEVEVRADPVRESNFLSISFLSPLPISYLRSSELTVTVKVLDAGQLVEEAVVVTWGPDGRRLLMRQVAEGIYSVDFEVPAKPSLASLASLSWPQSARMTASWWAGKAISASKSSRRPSK